MQSDKVIDLQCTQLQYKFVLENLVDPNLDEREQRERTIYALKENWVIDPTGAAYLGERCAKSDTKHGYGKMIDIYGNLVIGRFERDCFLFGFVVNFYGELYIVGF